MADQLNVDIVNVRDVTQFTPETDITTMEFYSRKGSTNKKIDGAQVVAEVLTQSDLGTGFTNVSNNANLQTAITELDAAISGGGGGISYAAIDGGPLQAIGISGEVGYAGAAGSGIISLDNRWSMVKGDIVIDVANDTDGSNNFALTINVSNGTFNTWTGSGAHDLWIPQIEVYDISAVALSTALGVFASPGSSTVITPQVTWSANSVTYSFDGATDFGGLSYVLVTIKP